MRALRLSRGFFALPKGGGNLNAYASTLLRGVRGFSSLEDLSSVEIQLPALSPTMEVGVINSWKKKVGEKIEAGDVIADIQTDKAVVDFECQDEGFLAAILVPEGEEHPVGTLVAIVVEEEEDLQKAIDLAKALPASDGAAAPPPASSVADTTPSAPSGGEGASSYAVKPLLPSVAILLERHHIDPSSVKPTGPKGNILKGDVLSALSSGDFREDAAVAHAEAPTAQAASVTETKEMITEAKMGGEAVRAGGRGYTDIPLTNMRKVIASRLTQSKKEVPHAYAAVRCSLDSILALRKMMKAQDKKPPSLNDFVIKASALALKDVPEANITWDEKSQRGNVQDAVDISIAVATPDGLITPIIKDANQKRLAEISSTMKDLATRAREKALLPEEFQGGTFTISNLGMFGIDHFSAVINPPQACILAVGGSADVMVEKKSYALDEYAEPGDLVKSSTMTVTLSSDERSVDQATCGRFLDAFRAYMEDPITML